MFFLAGIIAIYFHIWHSLMLVEGISVRASWVWASNPVANQCRKTLGLLMGHHAVSSTVRNRFSSFFSCSENISNSFSNFILWISGHLKPKQFLLTLSGSVRSFIRSFVLFCFPSTDSQSLQQIWESVNKTSPLSVSLTLCSMERFLH